MSWPTSLQKSIRCLENANRPLKDNRGVIEQLYHSTGNEMIAHRRSIHNSRQLLLCGSSTLRHSSQALPSLSFALFHVIVRTHQQAPIFHNGAAYAVYLHRLGGYHRGKGDILHEISNEQ